MGFSVKLLGKGGFCMDNELYHFLLREICLEKMRVLIHDLERIHALLEQMLTEDMSRKFE
ncbi:hypothetical protein bcgnr5414_54090 [Bacillus cereus]